MGLNFVYDSDPAPKSKTSKAGIPDLSKVDVPSLRLTPSDPLYDAQVARINAAQDINQARTDMATALNAATNLQPVSTTPTGIAGVRTGIWKVNQS
jgi:hypothetical protein